MLLLVVPHILLVRHPRFGIVAYRRINRFLQYLLEIKGGGVRNWAKRGLSVPSPKKKKNNSCLCFLFKSWIQVSVGIRLSTAFSVTHKLFVISLLLIMFSAWTIQRPFKCGLQVDHSSNLNYSKSTSI